MASVILRIEEGSEQGKAFRYDEAVNLVVGRRDPSSQANIQISPSDHYISRHHFRLEIRPPRVMVQDINSSNGTFIQRKGMTEWERINETFLNDGDRIKIGQTVFGLQVTEKADGAISTPSLPAELCTPLKPVAQPPDQVSSKALEQESVQPPKPAQPAEYFCIRCGDPLDQMPELQASFTDHDFMCLRCRATVQSPPLSSTRMEVQARCVKCGATMGDMANADGRAVELADIALYLCKKCAGETLQSSQLEIGEYQALSLLGKGGMGKVYQVWHRPTGRLAALKLLHEAILRNKEQLTINRFFRESAILESLKHPGMTRLYEMGRVQGTPYFISEYVAGGNLGQFSDPKGVSSASLPKVLGVIADTLAALDYIHICGYVHRDIKPENILISLKDGKILPKVADFGLARSYQRHGETYTTTGDSAGTPAYMAIEQLTNFKDSKPSVDIYSIGVVLYYLLTGHFPLNFPTPHEPPKIMLLWNPTRIILEDQPKPISHWRPDLPSALKVVADRAVRKFAEERFSTAAEFREELMKAF